MKRRAQTIVESAAQRRRTWFYMCNKLCISNDDQAVIANRFIPDNCPIKFKPNGEVSRTALFNHPRYWSDAYAHLKSIEGSRRKSHRRIDGSKSVKVSIFQIREINRLARQLGWGEGGDLELEYRVMRFAARQTGDGDSRAVHPLNFLTSSQGVKVIQGLLAMINRQKAKKQNVS